MNGKIGGQRPRPRVALLGNFATYDLEHFRRMFPTVWTAGNIDDLVKRVDVREIDLIVIASGVDRASDWPHSSHVVCFSGNIKSLPGPIQHSRIEIPNEAQTEEFLFPDVPLPISRRRVADYGNLTSVRGWPRLRLGWWGSPTEAEQQVATNIFNSGAIICELHTKLPLAVAFIREDTNLGVGWLPCVDTNKADWVELLVTQWAQYDEQAFPNFGDWTDSPEWMVAEEEEILSQIQALEQKKYESIVQIDKQIGELSTKLEIAKTDANMGRRRLITEQGEPLVDEVEKALNDIGFDVTNVDKLIGKTRTKREDLRLKHVVEGGEEWTAIVEVRGYTRSGGQTADLLRLERFADLYERETGQAPNKRIYIVNGQIELLLPSQRQEPLAAATDDVEVFSESDGIVIWSLDLFRALKATNPPDYPALIESIKRAQGRWVPIVASS